MCGRIYQTQSFQALTKLTKSSGVKNTQTFNPTYNMGPTNYIPAIRGINNNENWDGVEEQ